MVVQNDVRVTIRVNKDLKERADRLFSGLGMNMSTALNVFLHKAVDEGGIPFPVGSIKTFYGHAYSSADITSSFEAAVRNDVAANQRNGFPVARYDAESKRAYLEYADGTREYVNG